MICFKDKTFCNVVCGNLECCRNYTEEEKKAAEKWWDSKEPPVAFSPFKDTEYCDGYKKPEQIPYHIEI